jgi:hypothetical protein
MIIEKKYNIEVPIELKKINNIGYLKEFYYKTLNNIISSFFIEIRNHLNMNVVYIGPVIFKLLKESYSISTVGLNLGDINFRNFINITQEYPFNNEFIGYYIQRKLYYNNSIKNSIIVGGNKKEVELFINKKNRIEKLKKIKHL